MVYTSYWKNLDKLKIFLITSRFSFHIITLYQSFDACCLSAPLYPNFFAIYLKSFVQFLEYWGYFFPDSFANIPQTNAIFILFQDILRIIEGYLRSKNIVRH